MHRAAVKDAERAPPLPGSGVLPTCRHQRRKLLRAARKVCRRDHALHIMRSASMLQLGSSLTMCSQNPEHVIGCDRPGNAFRQEAPVHK